MLTLNTNMHSLNTQRVLRQSVQAQARTNERLSSGKRINSGADDAAGLATAERFNAQTRSLNQVVRNLNDGYSLAQTAEGAMGEVSNMLVRARELAVQAAQNLRCSKAEADATLAEYAELAEVDKSTALAATACSSEPRRWGKPSRTSPPVRSRSRCHPRSNRRSTVRSPEA